MKKILGLIGLLFTFNVFAQIGPLNLAAVLSGNTVDNVCYVNGSVGDPDFIMGITCGNKAGFNAGIKGKWESGRIISEFVSSGRWELAATMNGRLNNIVFVFTKK